MYQFPIAQSPTRRKFLFLQGPASPFFADLGRALKKRGHDVHRVNLCLGDRLFWPHASTNFRGPFEQWRAFLRRFLAEQRVTDIVLFGDCRPYHRVAVELAGVKNLPVHVFEQGYLRPDWITVELGGVNGHSSLPRDPELILREAAKLPPLQAKTVTADFIRRAYWDVAFNAANSLGRLLFPDYLRHRRHHPFVEYAGALRRLARRRAARRHAERETRRVLGHPGGYYLVPLQVDEDYQIREHCTFRSTGEFLQTVIESFAAHAPADAELLVKVHPFDTGLINRHRQTRMIARTFGVEERVTCIDGGHLPTLLEGARGVVVVNSTVGPSAIHHGRPTIALGTAIYDIPGLTFQDPLDRFWSDATAPDPALYQAFVRVVWHRTQLNGGFYCTEGIAMCVEQSADRLCAADAPVRIAGERPVSADAMPDLAVEIPLVPAE